jgi:hypothetical protein
MRPVCALFILAAFLAVTRALIFEIEPQQVYCLLSLPRTFRT